MTITRVINIKPDTIIEIRREVDPENLPKPPSIFSRIMRNKKEVEAVIEEQRKAKEQYRKALKDFICPPIHWPDPEGITYCRGPVQRAIDCIEKIKKESGRRVESADPVFRPVTIVMETRSEYTRMQNFLDLCIEKQRVPGKDWVTAFAQDLSDKLRGRG
jgi:hypothetical protein